MGGLRGVLIWLALSALALFVYLALDGVVTSRALRVALAAAIVIGGTIVVTAAYVTLTAQMRPKD